MMRRLCALLGSVVLWVWAAPVFAQDTGTSSHRPTDAGPPLAPPALPAPPAEARCGATLCCDNPICCCEAPRRDGLIAGAGIYLIQPYFQDNLAFVLQRTVGRGAGSPGTRVDDRVDITHHTDVAPLVWLGYLTEEGLGGRARYWYFRQGTNQTQMSSPSSGANGVLAFSAAPLGLALINGQGINVTSKLEVQVADLEGLNDLHAGNWDILLAAGVRLLRIEQGYNAFIPQSNLNTLLSGHSFQGAGPTLAMEARRPLGESGLALYGSARGSLVFGSAHQNASVPGLNESALDHRDRTLPIGELEVGVEYGRSVGHSRVFGQVALVGQDWFGAGNASRSTVNSVPGGALTGAGYTGDSDIAFFGVAFRVGVNY
jgi:hypothetical protein